ncbi:MAG: hypothetical protein IJB36_03875 [Clostridia bacterium]|nr:hypothetical protein [Clostridia bacterium]
MDKYKLLYEIKKRGLTVEQVCDSIGMVRSTFYRKCKGISEFTQSEIQKIVWLLELDTPMGIFFAEKVS